MAQYSPSLIQQLEIYSVSCDQFSHINQEIKALCLRVGCNQLSAVCFVCVQQFHTACQGSIKVLEEISQLVLPFLNVLSKLDYLKQHKNLSIRAQLLIAPITEKLIPIRQYLEHQGLNNLNQLGAFLKLELQASIIQQYEKVELEIQSQSHKKKVGQQIQSQSHQQNQTILPEAPPTNIEDLKNYILNLIQQNKAEEALKIVEDALQNFQINKNLLNLKGKSLVALSRYQEAIDCYDQIIQIDSKNPIPWHNKGFSLNALDRHKEALDCYNQAIQIDPNYAPSYNNKGGLLDSLKRYEEAIQCYEQAIQINPKLALSQYNKGNSLRSLSRNQEAIEFYNQAISIDPNFTAALINKGKSLELLHHYDEAIICYNKAIQQNPECKDAKALLERTKTKLKK